MEAAIHGIPGIAMSIDANHHAEIDFTPAAETAARIARRVLADGLPRDTFLNVNVPDLRFEQIRGARITRLGKRIYRDELIERQDPNGRNYYWIGGQPPTGAIEEEGTDVWAVAHQFVSITPVQMDMTSHALVARLKAWETDSLISKS
jgi:5'-nucleotidase